MNLIVFIFEMVQSFLVSDKKCCICCRFRPTFSTFDVQLLRIKNNTYVYLFRNAYDIQVSSLNPLVLIVINAHFPTALTHHMNAVFKFKYMLHHVFYACTEHSALLIGVRISIRQCTTPARCHGARTCRKMEDATILASTSQQLRFQFR